MTSAKKYLIAIGVCLALLAGAFSAGRFSAPMKVETKEVEKVVYKDRVVEKVVTVTVQAKAETKVVYIDRVVTKEGTVTEHIVEKTVDREKDTTKEATKEVATRDDTVEHSTTTVTTLRPDWRVAVLGGATFGTPALKIAGPLVLGAEVDRRIIGGVSVGLWANTAGAGGVSLSMEF